MGQAIRKLLAKRHIIQSKLAEALGYTHSTVTQWINGKTMPSSDSLIKMAKYFNVPLDVFVKCPTESNSVK